MADILKIFIKVMEAGIAFSLTVAILFAYYRTENPVKKRLVIGLSVAAGVLLGILSAILRTTPNLLNRANFNFYSMIPIVLSLLFILFLLAFRKRWEGRNARCYENAFTAGVILYTISSFFYYMPAVFLQVNSIVYYGESPVSTMVLFRVIGFVLGIGMMILSAAAVHATGTRLRSAQISAVLVITLLILGTTQLIVILQRLYSLRLIPRNPILFQVIAFVTNNSNYFFLAVMIFLAVAPLILIRQNLKITEPYDNKAQLRKIRYRMSNKRKVGAFFLVVLLINILSLTYIKAYANREVALSEPENYTLEDGTISIPLDDLEDGKLHRYEYKSVNGIPVRFIIIKKAEGSYGVCLDACEICGPSGYFMRKDEVVCKLCDVVMNKGTIGFKGGCNPIPFPFRVHDKKIKILTTDLDEQDHIFK